MNTLLRLGLLYIGLLLMSNTLWGQDKESQLPDTLLVDEYYINDVLVTANKKSERLSEVAASVSTLSSVKVKDKQIETLNDLTFASPSIHMPDYGSSLTSPIYIRGIGSRINEPAVGLYVDDIPYFEKAAFDFNLFDIESIEVLRGPQGTLYGRNSLGGIIKIYTENIKNRATTNFSVGFGNHDRKTYHLRQNLPLNDKLLASFSGNYMNHNGYYTNHYERNTIGGKEDLSGRVKLKYTPTENATYQLILDAKDTRNNGYPYARVPENGEKKTVNYNHNSYYRRDILSTGLKAEYDINDYTLNSVTSYQMLDDFQDIDQDFTPAQLVYVTQERRHHMLTQEINFTSPQKKRFEFVTGLFGFYQLRDKQVDVFYGEDAIPVFNLPAKMHKIKNYDKTTGGFAIFGQMSYKDFLIDNLKATAGLRYDYEYNELDYLYLLNMNDNERVQGDFVHDKSFPEILPKISFHYSWTDNLVQYFTYSKGYKSGGFNSTFERKQDQTYRPEYSLNYESGLKWTSNRITTSFALYNIDVKDKQVYQIDTLSHGPLLKNAAEANSRGLELEINHRTMKNWSNYFTIGYTHAKYEKYLKDPADNIDYRGNFIPYIPRYTFTVGSNYRWVVSKGILDELRFHASYNGIGKHYWDDENTMKENFYGLLNMRITGVFDRINCSIWAKNALNTDYNVFMFQAFNNTYSQKNAPLRFGLTISSNLNIPNLLNFR